MITQERLKELLTYNTLTGVFSWVKSGKGQNNHHRGNNGYYRYTIDGETYLAHRLAILYMDGYIPDFVDHKEGKSNAYANLRPCTLSQNAHNAVLRKDNTSGIKGVCFDKQTGLWRVRVNVNGKQHCAGRFVDKKHAEQAAIKLRSKLHGEFTNHGEKHD